MKACSSWTVFSWFLLYCYYHLEAHKQWN